MIGTIIDERYVVESMVGSGGMAVVYKARDLQSDEIVAIKILKDEYREDPEFVRRLEREARAGMTLSHENIVKCLNVGIYNGVNYIVFEYVTGHTLKEYIKRNGTFSPRAAVNIISQVLDAIAHAHEKGIIHRDVKPQNVMITSKGIAKLGDFGIARDSASITKTFGGSSIMGSVHYLSPEQAKGAEVTERSDLYSVGIMLYEMLTGEVPFDGDNSVSVALMHLSDDMRPPIEINPKIPPALNYVILKATAKEPLMRYEKAEVMKADLQKALTEPNGKFAKPIIKVKRKLNIATLVIVGALFAVIVGIGISLSVAKQKYLANHFDIPNLVGMTIEDAIEQYDDSFEIIEVEKRSDPNFSEAGYIISQTPTGTGSKVEKDYAILVVVSVSDKETVVPDLSDMILSTAGAKIKENYLHLIGIEYVPDVADKKLNCVFEQSITPGTVVERGTEITIKICGEKPEGLTYPPDCCGKQLVDVLTTLGERGFMNITVRYVDSDVQSNGSVLTQSIDPWVAIPVETKLELTVVGTLSKSYYFPVSENYKPTADGDVKITITVITGLGYELVVYEDTLTGKTGELLTIKADLYYGVEGKLTYVIYAGGTEIKRLQATFASPTD